MKKLTFLIAASFCAGTAQAAPLKKCVDDKGRVYYGDSIPADVLDKCRTSSELSSKGLEKQKTRYPTEEERKSHESAEAQQKIADEKAREQKHRDMALLGTYTDIKEIDLSRDRNLQATQAQIDGGQMRVKTSQGRLAGLRAQADVFTKNKKPIPADLSAEVTAAEHELNSAIEVVGKWKREYETIRLRFEENKKRFRELKGLPPEQPAAAAPTPVKSVK